MRRRPAEIAEAAVAGVVWAALAVGLALTALLSPEYTSASSDALGIARTAGLSQKDVAALSERVRAFVADQDPGTLPATWAGEPAFDGKAVSHLEDVRRVILGGRAATGVAAGTLAAYLGVCVARRRRWPLAASMRTGAVIVAILLVLAVLAGVGDFGAFFTFFHGLFFASGTWTFPWDSLLIRLFPARFWVCAGASWAVLAAVGAALLAITARYVSGPSREEGSIRTAQDV